MVKDMEIVKQENIKNEQQENNSQSTKQNSVRVIVPPKEVFDNIAELQKKYRETVEQENR